MRCESCANAIQNSLSSFKELKNLNVYKSETNQGGFAEFTLEKTSKIQLQEVLEEIQKLGHKVPESFIASLLRDKEINQTLDSSQPNQTEERTNHLKKAVISALVALPLIALSVLGITLPILPMAIVGACSTATMVYSGYDIFQQGIMAPLRSRTLTMDTLFALSALSAFTLSLAAFIIPTISFEFQSALLIFASRHFGEYLESKMHKRAGQGIEYSSLLPKQVEKIEPYTIQGLEKRITVNIALLATDDIVELNSGDYIPVDGKLLSEHGQIYKTFINGNLNPEKMNKGELVYAGMRIANGPVRVQVTKPFTDSYLADWENKLATAGQNKTATERFVGRVIQYFIPGVLILAMLSGLIVMPLMGSSVGLHTFMAILVGACPCTLGFITRIAMRVGLSKSAQHGALIFRKESIEDATELDTVIFDLNGTLTLGEPTITDMHTYNGYDSQTALQRIYQIESAIEELSHPIGMALKNYAEQHSHKLPSESIASIQTSNKPGVQTTINGINYTIGNGFLMNEIGIDVEASPQRIFIAENNRLIAHFDIQDKLHSQAKAIISKLKSQNLDVILCTGADHATAQYYAKRLGINTVKANCFGGIEKQSYIKSLKNRKILMIGDAVNDALALETATVGIAVAQSAQITKSHADVLIQNKGLKPIIYFLENAKQTMSTVKQNLLLSLGYNLCVMAFTSIVALYLGPIAPSAMAMLMVVQSLGVLANTCYLKERSLDDKLELEDQSLKEVSHSFSPGKQAKQRISDCVAKTELQKIDKPSCCKSKKTEEEIDTELGTPTSLVI